MSNELLKRFVVLALCVGVFSCDNKEPREVPSGAGRGLAPAKIELRAPPKPAQDAEVVVAWVNSEPIRRSVVDAHVARLRSRDVDEQRARVLEAVIDETLLDQWSRNQKAVTDEDVDAEINSTIARVFRSKAALAAHVSERQSTMEAYRAEVRRRLAERSLSPPPADAPAGDPAIHALYREVASRPPTVTSFRVASVLIPKDQADEQIGPLLESSRDEPGFARLPGRRTDLGWVEEKALNSELVEALRRVTPPGRSQPIATPSGLEVYWVHERSTQPTPHFTQLEPILRRRLDSIALANSRAELLRKLRAEAEIRREAQPERPRSEVSR